MSQIPSDILNRKGARNLASIPEDVLAHLNAGKVPTVNLVEWLAIDHINLLKTVLNEVKEKVSIDEFETAVLAEKKPTANTNIRIIGTKLAELGVTAKTMKHLRAHTSDTVRCWACWADSTRAKNTHSLLQAMRPYAGDGHFGVHEVVIFASKEKLAGDLQNSISKLQDWATHADENVRRYAAETIRPVGVWTKKIAALQEDPELALPVLERLKTDPSRYVQNAVANWINDASKSQPEWARALCTRWSKDSSSKETTYIVKRGMRTLDK